MDLLCGGGAVMIVLGVILVLVILAGGLALLKLGVFASYALRQEPDDQAGQVYSLDQSQAAGTDEPPT